MELCDIVQDSSADCGIGCALHGEAYLRHVCMTPELIEALDLCLVDWNNEIGEEKARVGHEFPKRAYRLRAALKNLLKQVHSK